MVVRRAFDPGPLAAEFEAVLAQATPPAVGGGGVGYRYRPMTSWRTPVSLALIDRFVPVARQLIGRAVLPVRAKGVRYTGSANLHRDSDHPVASIGVVAYLEPLAAGAGAFEVVPGSHRRDPGGSCEGPGRPPARAVPTDPGDVIVFDEHLWHGSRGGRQRRQWRIDYVEDPVGPDAEARVRAYLEAIFPDDGTPEDGVIDWPSYGPDWMASGRPWVARLAELGLYDAARRHEGQHRP